MSPEEIQALKVARGHKKGPLTRAMNDIGRYVVEEDKEEVVKLIDDLKVKLRTFEQAHDEYHNQLTEEVDIADSEKYYYDVQAQYIDVIKGAKQWLKSLETSSQIKDEKESSESSRTGMSAEEIINVVNMPKWEPEHFHGDPSKFHTFFALFDENVHDVTTVGKVRLNRLLQSTRGDAHDAIHHCGMVGGEEGYQKARKILKDRFGNDHIISQELIKSLKNGKPVKSSVELQHLADELTVSQATLEKMGKVHQIDTQSSIIQIADRLQSYLRGRWKKHAMDVKRDSGDYPDFGAFVKFVSKEAQEATDPVYGDWNVRHSKSTSDTVKKSSTTSFSTSSYSSSGKKRICMMCGGDHRLLWCKAFQAMKLGERLKFVDEKKLCVNCLLNNHVVEDCRKNTVCSVPGCGKKHTRYLHVDQNSTPVNANTTSRSDCMTASVCVPVVPVTVNDKFKTCALLDTGSTSSFCTRKLIDSVGVKGSSITYTLSTLSKSEEVRNAEVVNLNLTSADGSEQLKLTNVYVVENIPVSNPGVNVSQHAHLQNLPVHKNGSIEVLIGQDHPEALVPLEVRKGGSGDPFAVRTLFGWSLNGPLTSSEKVSKRVISHFVTTDQVENDFQKLWNVEHDCISSKVGMSVEDKSVLQLWDKSVEFVNGHYQIPIPFKNDVTIPSNLCVALSRLESLGKSLKRRNLYEKYNDEILKLCNKGYAERVPVYDVNQKHGVWYLPHQVVISENKPGKIRVVYDCASKYMGQSLNDKCLRGPDLINRLQHVLLRFRNHEYAISADVEAMYYQVHVPVSQRDYLRFLWFNSDGAIEHYRMAVHVFGGVWSGAAAGYALQRTVNDFSVSTLVRNVVRDAFYVDDLLISLPNFDNALEVMHGVKDVLHCGGFNLTKFVANDDQLINEVAEIDRAVEVKELNLESQSKVLGVKWNVKSDNLYFDLQMNMHSEITRRTMLSTVSSLFDPIGLIAPVLVKGRILFQDVTRLKLPWDETVPPDVSESWSRWLHSLDDLKHVVISRCIKPKEFDDAYAELHHFSDASERAYGCCSYLRLVSKSGKIHVVLVCGKGRVAPIHSCSIPRLELQAAVLAARVDSMLKDELHISLGESKFWTDSRIVLQYIKNESKRFHVFVANRVGEIRNLSTASQWNHVSGEVNPADIVSRGMDPETLRASDWFVGPKFLHEHKSEWKCEGDIGELSVDDPEVKNVKVNLSLAVDPISVAGQSVIDDHPLDILTKHFSSWNRLKRSVGWLLRIRDHLCKRNPEKGPLSVSEIHAAETVILKHVQGEAYSKDIQQILHGDSLSKSSPIRDLLPVLKDGLLRVGGRIRRGFADLDAKHPIIVPHKSHVAVLIAREFHETAHVGVEWSLSMMRSRFWITRARSILRRVKLHCVTCRKLYSLPCEQRMADLPAERLMPGYPPFTFVGTDCFGPVMVKFGRAQVKRFMCVFTCFTTRAVHLEMLCSMDTDSMINALRRFMARRGTPQKIWSDNGTNFVGCNNELLQGLKQLNNSKIHAYCVKQNVVWMFNPPHAPHMGGVFERMVQTVKKVLNVMLGNARLTDEILCTLLCEVENLVNSRPITRVSNDGCDVSALSPNHLLLLKGDSSPLPGEFCVADVYKRRWRHTQHLVDVFWKRWVKEYIPQLQRANKWQNVRENVKVNDIVLIVDENTPRGLWPLGIVSEVKVSGDGLVRTVHVKTQSTTLVRPISKIVWLESCI